MMTDTQASSSSTNIFGGSGFANAGGIFGAPSSSGSIFGTPSSSGSIFGTPSSGGGIFGTPSSGGGIFGNPSTSSFASPFGGDQSNVFGAASSSSFGGFGSGLAPPTSKSAPATPFGASSAFNQTTPGFGQSESSQSIFGQPAGSGFGSNNAFGAAQTQGFGGFGASAAPAGDPQNNPFAGASSGRPRYKAKRRH